MLQDKSQVVSNCFCNSFTLLLLNSRTTEKYLKMTSNPAETFSPVAQIQLCHEQQEDDDELCNAILPILSPLEFSTTPWWHPVITPTPSVKTVPSFFPSKFFSVSNCFTS